MEKEVEVLEEKPTSKKKNTKFIVIIVLLVLVILGLVIYIGIDKGVIFSNTNNNQISKEEKDKTTNETEKNTSSNEEDLTPVEEVKSNSVIPFDSTKVLNSSEKNYTLSCQGRAGIWITVDATQQQITFSFTPTKVVEEYPLNWTSTKNDVASNPIKFDKKIVDVYFGGMGQSNTGDTLFILLEDGTVEYIPIVHMFNHVQGAVVSYGQLAGITDVTKFVTASTTGGVTTLAIKSDGTFYDLSQVLSATGNY